MTCLYRLPVVSFLSSIIRILLYTTRHDSARSSQSHKNVHELKKSNLLSKQKKRPKNILCKINEGSGCVKELKLNSVFIRQMSMSNLCLFLGMLYSFVRREIKLLLCSKIL